MLIAAVLNENEIILPIVEGTVLRIYDTERKVTEDFPNPANDLTEGRRGAALKFAEEKGAKVFVAPPNTFCELSYNKAKKDNIKFFHISQGLSFTSFEQALEKQEIQVQSFLPENEVVPS